MLLIGFSFCSTWWLWWLLPFLLGLLLGSILWKGNKTRIEELERQLATEKGSRENLEYELKKVKVERDDMSYKFERINTQNAELNTTVTRLRKKQSSNIIVPPVPVSRLKEEKSSSLVKTQASSTEEKEKNKEDEKESVTNDSGIPDTNLQIIEGIGPRMESILKENDINTWYDITKKSDIELRAILDKYGGRYSIVDPTGWPKQAKLAHKGKWDKLIKLQSEDGSSSKAETYLKKKKKKEY